MGDTWERITVIFNGNKNKIRLPLPKKKYLIVASDSQLNESGISASILKEIIVEGISTTILVE